MEHKIEPPVRILVVDDDEISRKILQDTIEQEGIEISLAANGLEGLKRLLVEPFDIVLTDLNMPRMDGLTLLREIRKLYPHILVIIITGYGSLNSAIDAIRNGAYDYVQKPFTTEEMRVTCRNAIEKIHILRDKQRLLKELELVYRKLYGLEAERRAGQSMSSIHFSTDSPDTPESRYIFPMHTLPLPIFEEFSGSARILGELERLKDLKHQGIINNGEFESLRKAILNKIESS